MKKTALIISGGSINYEFAKEYVENNLHTLLIVADNGLKVADELGLQPDFAVGDFDTASIDLINKYKNKSTEFIEYNRKKDFSDTELAVDIALDNNCEEIHLLVALGSRFDHTLANVYLLQKAINNNVNAVIHDVNNRINIIGGNRRSIQLEKSVYKYFSLIPLSEKVTGINVTGAEYNLENAILRMDCNYSLGISNEIKDKVIIEINTGYLLVIESKD